MISNTLMISRELILANSSTYSDRFGIDLSSDPFQWFLLSVLFGARISRTIAIRTFIIFRANGVTSPEAILNTGFDGLVSILDSGGYARYDFRTAVKLEHMSRNIMREGGLNRIHESSSTPDQLIASLKGLARGIGDVTVGIFMREMTGVWKNARPYPSDLVLQGAEFAGTSPGEYGRFEVSYAQFESFLFKVGKECARKWSKKQSGFCKLVRERE